jgi:hypothetical protein
MFIVDNDPEHVVGAVPVARPAAVPPGGAPVVETFFPVCFPSTPDGAGFVRGAVCFCPAPGDTACVPARAAAGV